MEENELSGAPAERNLAPVGEAQNSEFRISLEGGDKWIRREKRKPKIIKK